MDTALIAEDEYMFEKCFLLRSCFTYNEKNVASFNYLLTKINLIFAIEECSAYVRYIGTNTECVVIVKLMTDFCIRKKDIFNIENPDVSIRVQNYFNNEIFESTFLLEFLDFQRF